MSIRVNRIIFVKKKIIKILEYIDIDFLFIL